MVPMGGSFYFGLASPMLSLDLPFTGYFICILCPQHDYVFHERYTDYFTVNFIQMLMHARAIGTRPLVLRLRPGYEASFGDIHLDRPYQCFRVKDCYIQ